ncbi:MAG: hypothetical protein OXI30_00390 [Chloroflexota bacterium]|nr:hypothetical protein [Chloroflexota bacterium]
MPYEFEVAATSCELAREILDVGIEAYKAVHNSATAYNYMCVENVSLAPPASQIFLTVYLVGLIPSIIGWSVLYRRGAPAGAFFKWGICCGVVPVFGPIVALLGSGIVSGAFGRSVVIGRLQEVGNRNADDTH